MAIQQLVQLLAHIEHWRICAVRSCISPCDLFDPFTCHVWTGASSIAGSRKKRFDL